MWLTLWYGNADTCTLYMCMYIWLTLWGGSADTLYMYTCIICTCDWLCDVAMLIQQDAYIKETLYSDVIYFQNTFMHDYMYVHQTYCTHYANVDTCIHVHVYEHTYNVHTLGFYGVLHYTKIHNN